MDKQKEQHKIDELILAYLQGTASRDEEQELAKWVAASEENKQYFEQEVKIWTAAAVADTTYPFNTDRAFLRFRKEIEKRQGRQVAPLSFSRFIRAAAAAVLLALVSYLSFYGGGRMVENQLADIVLEAPLGSKSKLYLPDGTLVWLNAGSQITYSQGFGIKERQIELNGEAYFEVSRNEQLPFQVNTKDLNVQVLGTKFNLRNYADDTEASIELLEGKVQVRNYLKDDLSLYLTENERAILDKQSGIMLKRRTQAAKSREWTNNTLFFDEDLLADIVKELERSYNVTILLEDPDLMSQRFYGYFNTLKQPVTEVLDMFSETGNIRYYYKGQTIIIVKSNINKK